MSTMQTWLRCPRSIEAQQIAPFTGEGAYHGSTRPSPSQPPPPPLPMLPMVEEMRPRTLEADEAAGKTAIDVFRAHFPSRAAVVGQLPEPSEEEVVADAVTFVWCPLQTALREAGPLTRRVLEAMQPHLTHTRRHIYIDTKIQRFQVGDLPVDSHIWHIDGSIVVRDARAQRRGFPLLHDMKARLEGERPPQYLAYLSSTCSATQFAAAPVTVPLPALIPRFDALDQEVRRSDPPVMVQPAGAIVRFDGLSLHRPRPARRDGWRLWIRCVETDREVHLTQPVIACYNTVFRPAAGIIEASPG